MNRQARWIVAAATLLLPLGTLVAADAPAKVDNKSKAKAAVECEQTTATRIRSSKPGECVISASPTRTYTKQDLERTGQVDTGEALKQLDPRFR